MSRTIIAFQQSSSLLSESHGKYPSDADTFASCWLSCLPSPSPSSLPCMKHLTRISLTTLSLALDNLNSRTTLRYPSTLMSDLTRKTRSPTARSWPHPQLRQSNFIRSRHLKYSTHTSLGRRLYLRGLILYHLAHPEPTSSWVWGATSRPASQHQLRLRRLHHGHQRL